MLGATREGLTFNGRQFAAWSRITALVPAGPTGLVVRWRGMLLRRSHWLTLESPDSTRRIAELAALAPTLAPEERVRVVEISGGISSPRLRVVTEAVLDGDEAKVERALLAVAATPR